MANTGKNYPCPCQSGTTYINCCFLKEQGSVLSLDLHRLKKISDKSTSILLKFGKKLYGENCLIDAWDDFWLETNEVFNPETPYIQLFIPWFLYNWVPDELVDEKNHTDIAQYTIVAKYLYTHVHNLDLYTKCFMEAAQKEPLSYWEVQSVTKDIGLHLKDIINGREIFVHEKEASKKLMRSDIIFGQVVGLKQFYILNASGPYFLPSRIKNLINSNAEFIKINDRGEISNEPKDIIYHNNDLLDIYNAIVYDILNQGLPELKNTDHEEIIFSKSIYNVDTTDTISVVINRLSEIDNIIQDTTDNGEFLAIFLWINTNNRKNINKDIRGLIKVSDRTVITECNSIERDKALKNILIKELGPLLIHKTTVYDNPDFEFNNKPVTKNYNASDFNNLPLETRMEIIKHIEKMHLKWLDETVPLLGDITPKEAVRTDDGKNKVIEMINEWEDMQLRNINSHISFDFNKLRSKLGLLSD